MVVQFSTTFKMSDIILRYNHKLRGSATFVYFFFIIEPRKLKFGMRM